jgi:hypothetical protein
MEEDPEAGQSMMNLHIKRNCSGLKNSRRNCSRRNLPHRSLTFFAISLISFSVFLMRVEYGPNPCSSPQSKARPKPRTKEIGFHSIQDQWDGTLGWAREVSMSGMRNLQSTNSSHVTSSNIPIVWPQWIPRQKEEEGKAKARPKPRCFTEFKFNEMEHQVGQAKEAYVRYEETPKHQFQAHQITKYTNYMTCWMDSKMRRGEGKADQNGDTNR